MPKTAHPQVQRLAHPSNLYLIESTEDGLILIDAAMPGALKPLRKAVAALGKSMSDIQHILVTHADVDHIGSLAGIKDATGATVYAGVASKGHIENHTNPPHVPVFMKPFFWPIMPFVKPTQVDVTVQAGDTLPLAGGIVPFATPGHTADHFAYYWTEGNVLFAGDLFFRIGKLGLTPGVLAWDNQASAQSAAEVLALKPRHLMLGHGTPLDTDQAKDAAEVEGLLAALHADEGKFGR